MTSIKNKNCIQWTVSEGFAYRKTRFCFVKLYVCVYVVSQGKAYFLLELSESLRATKLEIRHAEVELEVEFY